MYKAILFDLDGTLLPMDNDEFTRGYLGMLSAAVAPLGYNADTMIPAMWRGVAAMVKNDGSRTNEAVFWEILREKLGERVMADMPTIEKFYPARFDEVQRDCGFDGRANQTVKRLKDMGYRIALATNPLFPRVATESRIRWAGLDICDFELVTTFENSSRCKPNPLYFADVARTLAVMPEECLMIGNDVEEDAIAASAAGMRVFLLTDGLINRGGHDLNAYPNGSFEDLLAFVEKLGR